MRVLNFINMCYGDVDAVHDGKEERAIVNMCADMDSAYMREITVGKKDIKAWAVVLQARFGQDPKIHFTDYDKAIAFYNYVVGLLTDGNSGLVTIDVLQHGAI